MASLDVVKDTSEIAVNVLDIEIHSVHLKGASATQSSKAISYDKDNNRAIFAFNDKISAGTKATLEIKFTGQLNNNMCGKFVRGLLLVREVVLMTTQGSIDHLTRGKMVARNTSQQHKWNLQMHEGYV